MQTHLEPLAERRRGREVGRGGRDRGAVVREATGGAAARAAAACARDEGLVAFLTLGLDPADSLAEAHARASEVEERLRRARPDIADVIVHTEP